MDFTKTIMIAAMTNMTALVIAAWFNDRAWAPRVRDVSIVFALAILWAIVIKEI